jgi:DNA replication protein DnaC
MTTKLALVSGQERQETCETHGVYTAIAKSIRNLDVYWPSCPGCEAEREAERLEQSAKEARIRLEEKFLGLGIPRRFFHKTLANYEAKNAGQSTALKIAKDYVANFGDHLKAGRCAIFSGKLGTGKSHLAIAILRGVLEKQFADLENWRQAPGYSVKYATVAEIVREIRDTWSKRSEISEGEAYRKFAKPDLLVLDEVGLQAGSANEQRVLEELFDMRYRNMRSTIVSTNLNKADIPKFIGERSFDRLRENSGIFALFDWESHRGEQ